jgi:hypothetical protein
VYFVVFISESRINPSPDPGRDQRQYLRVEKRQRRTPGKADDLHSPGQVKHTVGPFVRTVSMHPAALKNQNLPAAPSPLAAIVAQGG